MSANKTILICQCAERGLLNLGNADEVSGLVVPDLCCAAQKNDPRLKDIAAAEYPVIYACHPRAVRALFAFAGYPLPESAEFINLRTPVLPHSRTPVLPHSQTLSWFPVIDGDRCTNCGQCFEFCLFGVYEKDADGKVRVTNPQSCKNNCPACARICPEAAIIFPKVGEAPINGAEISDEEALKANIKINVDEILGNDVYAALNARKQKRRTLLNQKKVEQALAERKKCAEEKV
ncbi:MAG: ferredoxin family protein [Kiritimatiellaceae bacterium]|nr:ferredoxin family protein [Kiritimatiellaceae bacterium]